MAQLVKNPPAMQETWVWSLGWERSPGEGKRYVFQYSGLENSRDCTVHGVTKSQTWLSDFYFHFLYIIDAFQWRPMEKYLSKHILFYMCNERCLFKGLKMNYISNDLSCQRIISSSSMLLSLKKSRYSLISFSVLIFHDPRNLWKLYRIWNSTNQRGPIPGFETALLLLRLYNGLLSTELQAFLTIKKGLRFINI